MLILSAILFILSMALSLDGVFLSGGLYFALPAWTGTAAALLGLGLAAIPYKRRKGMKKREWPLGWMLLNTFAAVLALGFWGYRLILAALA